MKTIAVINGKGGIAKTVTTQAIATLWKNKKKRVLMIDTDPQHNLSFSIKAETETKPTLYNLLKGEVKAENTIQTTHTGDILPSSLSLGIAEKEFISDIGKEFLLKEAIANISKNYDYIIIDCPPNSLSLLTLNAMVTSDYILIPSVADVFSLQGIGALHQTITNIKKYYNNGLEIAGILLTRYNTQTKISKHIQSTLKDITKQLNVRLFNTAIRNSVSISEAQLKQENLLNYDNDSNAINDYKKFLKELESVINGN